MHSIASAKSGSPAHNFSRHSTSDPSPRLGRPCGEKLLEQLDPMLRGLSARLAGPDLSLRAESFREGVVAVLSALERFASPKGLVERSATRPAWGELLA